LSTFFENLGWKVGLKWSLKIVLKMSLPWTSSPLQALSVVVGLFTPRQCKVRVLVSILRAHFLQRSSEVVGIKIYLFFSLFLTSQNSSEKILGQWGKKNFKIVFFKIQYIGKWHWTNWSISFYLFLRDFEVGGFANILRYGNGIKKLSSTLTSILYYRSVSRFL
jgi:hypothetical protein